MSETHDVTQLEKRLDELEAEQASLRAELKQAQVDQWQGRVDDLEVQLHLGLLETADLLDPLLDALRNRWLDAREQIGEGSAAAGDSLVALREGVEQAMRDIRQAVDTARKSASR